MSLKPWPKSKNIRHKLLENWASGKLMTTCLDEDTNFPLLIKLKKPNNKELSEQFSTCQEWVTSWQKIAHKAPFILEWHTINHRQLGTNQLPKAIVFNEAHHLTEWLGVTPHFANLKRAQQHLVSHFPSLNDWILQHPEKLLKIFSILPKLISIVAWYLKNPTPNCYLRQLTLPDIDTKFIEQNVSTLHAWLQLLLPDIEKNAISSVKQFAKYYGFKEKPVLVRFKILDSSLVIQGLTDISIPAEDFAQLNLDVMKIYVCENDINALTLPPTHKAMVIFGRGYGFNALQKAGWLQNKVIHYWGDIDTHGFAILNSFRHHFPQTKSFLMDEETLLNHQTSWTLEPKQTHAKLDKLTIEEQSLYQRLCSQAWGDNVRLEQEYVNYHCVLATI